MATKFCSFSSPSLNFMGGTGLNIFSLLCFIYCKLVCTCDLLLPWPCQTFSPFYQFRAKYVIYFRQQERSHYHTTMRSMCIRSAFIVFALNVLWTNAHQSNPPREVDCDTHYCSNWIEHMIGLVNDGPCDSLITGTVRRNGWILVRPQRSKGAAGFVGWC